MKKFFLFLIFNYSLFTLQAQRWLWGKEGTPGSFSYGEPGGNHSITTDANGNTYMTGCFHNTISFGVDTLVNNSPNYLSGIAMLLVKSDSNGNVLWARQSFQASFSSSATGSSVVVDKDGTVFITGMFNDTITIGSTTLHSTGYNMFLAKYTPNGNVLWAKQFDSRGNFAQPFPTDITKDIWGNIYVSGQLTDSVFFGPYILSSYYNHTSTYVAFLVKFDTSGNPIWAKQGNLSGPNPENFGASVAADNRGNIYLTGSFTDTVKFGTHSLFSKSNRVGFLIKYDTGGNVIWASQSISMGHSSFCNPNSITTDRQGNPYVTGMFYDTVNFDGHFLYDNGAGNMFVVKYDTLGKAIWVLQSQDLTLTSWSGTSITSDTLKQSGSFVAIKSGAFNAPYLVKIGSDTLKLNQPNNSASIVLHLDSAGKVQCSNIFSEGDEDDGDAIVANGSGTKVFWQGDLANKEVFGNDTLKYGSDCPFTVCWQPCNISDTGTIPPPPQSEPCNSLFIPNAFSPNNDGQNDFLYVRGYCIKAMDFAIFDRWGNKVFESESESVGWDGTYKGVPMNTGTYMWYLKGTMNDGTTFSKKGTVALIR